jgi:hypothetical protein
MNILELFVLLHSILLKLKIITSKPTFQNLLFLDLDSEISWNNFINLKNLRSNKEDLKEQYSKWIERQKERPKTTLQTLTAQTKSTASKRENQNKSYTYAKS